MSLLISGYGDTSTLKLWKKAKGCLWKADLPSPSFLVAYQSFVFVASETKKNACVYSFKQTEKGLELISQLSVEGSELCHLSFSPRHRLLVGSCWGSGQLITMNFQEDGQLSNPTVLYQAPVSANQVSRVHCSLFNGEESALYVINLGLDCLYQYSVQEGTLIEGKQIFFPAGVAPRHAVLSEEESVMYILTENSNEVFVYSLLEDRFLQTISTLDSESPDSHCSAIVLSTTHQKLYTANRGEDCLSVFSILPDHRLERLSTIPCNGEIPRHMILSNDEKYLIIAYQGSGYVSFVSLDPQGIPHPENALNIFLPHAACMAELPD